MWVVLATECKSVELRNAQSIYVKPLDSSNGYGVYAQFGSDFVCLGAYKTIDCAVDAFVGIMGALEANRRVFDMPKE